MMMFFKKTATFCLVAVFYVSLCFAQEGPAVPEPGYEKKGPSVMQRLRNKKADAKAFMRTKKAGIQGKTTGNSAVEKLLQVIPPQDLKRLQQNIQALNKMIQDETMHTLDDPESVLFKKARAIMSEYDAVVRGLNDYKIKRKITPIQKQLSRLNFIFGSKLIRQFICWVFTERPIFTLSMTREHPGLVTFKTKNMRKEEVLSSTGQFRGCKMPKRPAS